MKILGSPKLNFDDVLIRPKSSQAASRKEVVLSRHFKRFPHSPRNLNCKPLMVSNMDTTGTFRMATEVIRLDWITCLHKHYDLFELVDFYNMFNIINNSIETINSVIDCVWYSLGISDDDIDKLKSFIDETGLIPNLCVDVANGYSDHFVDKVAEIRDVCPSSIIMAGNVATPEMVDRIIRQGKADIVKIGIGPGSVCTTRLVTGVGYPQLSAILECADAAHGNQNGFICADGGCRTSGDVCKALGANADFVMLGGMIAGTGECEGEWEYNEDSSKHRLKYYGMSSYEAQDKYNGGVQDHRGSEGKSVFIDYKGPVRDICRQIEGGIRSCCSYIGARRIKHMGRCTTFVQSSSTHNTVFSGGEQWARK